MPWIWQVQNASSNVGRCILLSLTDNQRHHETSVIFTMEGIILKAHSLDLSFKCRTIRGQLLRTITSVSVFMDPTKCVQNVTEVRQSYPSEHVITRNHEKKTLRILSAHSYQIQAGYQIQARLGRVGSKSCRPIMDSGYRSAIPVEEQMCVA